MPGWPRSAGPWRGERAPSAGRSPLGSDAPQLGCDLGLPQKTPETTGRQDSPLLFLSLFPPRHLVHHLLRGDRWHRFSSLQQRPYPLAA